MESYERKLEKLYDPATLRHFFEPFANLLETHQLCNVPQCRRNKCCRFPRLDEVKLDPLSIEGRRMTLGIPYCLAVVWDGMQQDVFDLLQGTYDPDRPR